MENLGNRMVRVGAEVTSAVLGGGIVFAQATPEVSIFQIQHQVSEASPKRPSITSANRVRAFFPLLQGF